MKYGFNDLCLEVTRKCNMSCDHCLRGCAQNEDMTKDTIDALLAKTDYIGTLTFTGGEPVLNADLIIYTIDRIMRERISVTSFYMVTNAGVFDKDLFFKIIEFYHYMDDNEYSNVCVSLDGYHDGRPEFIDWWKSLAFYSNAKEQEDSEFSHRLISEGNAGDNGLGSRSLELSDEMPCENNCCEEMFYVNVNGEIVNDCDMSYDTQSFNVLGHVDDIDSLYAEKNNDE